MTGIYSYVGGGGGEGCNEENRNKLLSSLAIVAIEINGVRIKRNEILGLQ